MRPPRIPGTRSTGRTLYVLPGIPDAWPAELKSALAIRNTCATEGLCPDCGATGELTVDRKLANVWHYTFRHEADCRAWTDAA